MNEFDPSYKNSPKETLNVDEIIYKNAYHTLSQITKRFVGVDNADELLQGCVGVGRALDTIIRANGEQAPKGTDNPGECYNFTIPLDPYRSDKGHLIATTDGRIISLYERPRVGDIPDTRKLPPESTFLTIPVNDMTWKQPDAETPAIKIGTGEKQFPTQQPDNGLLQQVYAATLRQGIEKIIGAAASFEDLPNPNFGLAITPDTNQTSFVNPAREATAAEGENLHHGRHRLIPTGLGERHGRAIQRARKLREEH